MYAISHAATALVLKRRYPTVSLWPLLVAVQAMELLWVLFTYTGLEHVTVTPDAVHLDFLPYSHSVFTALALGAMAWLVVARAFHRPALGAAIALGIVSHLVLDLVQHEPDITLLPLAWGPRFGLGLAHWPIANLVVELAYGVFCWWIFGGTLGLLVGIVLYELIDLVFMAPRPGSLAPIVSHPTTLTTIILIQILTSWLLVRWLARERTPAAVEVPAV